MIKAIMTVILEAKNLNVLNKANNLIFANNISFAIQQSEIWRFRGPNGIGKTSFYEALIGLRNINSGEVLLHNQPISKLSPTERVSLGIKYSPQNSYFFKDLTIYQNLKIFADALVEKKQREDTINFAIAAFQINEFAYKLPSQLSGGQLRLSELTKLLIGPYTIGLLDEPFAALDLLVIEKVCEILIQQKENGISFIINDHNLKAVESISDFDLALTKNTVKIVSLTPK